MKVLITTLLAAACLAGAPAMAQHSGHGDHGQQAASAATDTADGEIKKVDKDAKKVTIKHGEIKNLEMPGMTMVFQVKDPAMLDAVKPGDKVMFKVEKANGALVVTEMRAAK